MRMRVARHTAVAMCGAVLVGLFWSTRPNWDPEMRLWKAVGDSALILLLASLAIGPLAKLWKRAGKAVPWRREIGIWFALIAAVHALLILNGWARWSLDAFLGYQFVPQLGREARMEPGFGLANVVGLVALLWALTLAATSTDAAVRRLGPAGWKWLHNASQVIFYLVLLHVGYFLFLHFTQSFHRLAPEPDWFRIPFVLLALSVIVLQWAAFARTVRRRRRDRGTQRSGRGRERGVAEAAS